ncbi:energy transducer TonB [Edaphobacter aggregans]|uniref:energy transducer TonB n=1 Tax=Edaphobacter aggregans TaxID=570835 RepID=UPI00054DA2AB|nr:energy transducer TonB [Edaphobacter aggregans]
MKNRLVGKPLYLRGFWREDSLHFDSYGQLIGKSGLLSFTLCGAEVDKVRLERDGLILEGKRVGVEFKGKVAKRVVLQVGDRPPFSDEMMHIKIDPPADGDFSRAVDTIFADDLPDLAPVLPQYWQRFARENLSSNSPASATPVSSSSGTQPLRKIGGGIKPPTIAKSKEPQFSQAARNLRYSGKVLVNLWVGEDGKPSHLAVIRPAGLGLDEQALYAVQQYVFNPAKENDKPVLVELNIEVAFDVY